VSLLRVSVSRQREALKRDIARWREIIARYSFSKVSVLLNLIYTTKLRDFREALKRDIARWREILARYTFSKVSFCSISYVQRN